MRRQIVFFGMVLILSFFVGSFVMASDVYEEHAILLASDGGDADYFGRCVAVDGQRIVVGANNSGEEDEGSVYVYDYNSSSDSWDETIITASDRDDGDRFGYSVAVDGDRIAIGAYGVNDKAGAVYIFDYNSDSASWTETKKITASDESSNVYFGKSVAIEGDRLVVGAEGYEAFGSRKGAAYIFEYSSSGEWIETKKLTASDGEDDAYFGCSVSLSGDLVVVGAKGVETNTGAVYVYDNNSGAWDETIITSSDAAKYDYFGISVVIKDDRMIIGASQYYDAGMGTSHTQYGKVYVFDKNSTDDEWIETTILAMDKTIGDAFGSSVDFDGDTIVVGVPHADDYGTDVGLIYVFEETSSGSWSGYELSISEGIENDYFGNFVAIDNNLIVAGAPWNSNDNGSHAGAAYVYKGSNFVAVDNNGSGLADEDEDEEDEEEDNDNNDNDNDNDEDGSAATASSGGCSLRVPVR